MSAVDQHAGHRTTDVARAVDALFAIPPDLPHGDWVRVGMAAHAAGLDFDTFNEWSGHAPNYSERVARDAWRSFKPGGGIGPGTLIHTAKEHGWQGSDKPRQRPAQAPRKAAEPPPRKPPPGMHPDEVWPRCIEATAAQPYVATKQGIPDGLRVVPDGDPLRIVGESMVGSLVVPAYAPDGSLQSLQLIAAPDTAVRLEAQGSPSKLNLPGSPMAGASFTVGPPDGPAYLCEGIGQAWACYQATGQRAVVCFGWGNVHRVATGLRQREPTARLVLVPDKGKEADAADIAREVGAAVACMPQGEEDNFDANDLLRRDGYDILAALLEDAREPGPVSAPEHDSEPADLFRVVDMAQGEHEDLAWFWAGYLPAMHVTMLGGHGGAGKSTFGAHLMACIGMGAEAFGQPTRRARVLYFSAEDPAPLVLRRLRRICRHLGLPFAEASEWVQIIDAADLYPVLFTERRLDGVRHGVTTPTYSALREYIEREGFEVLIVDNASDAFDADEISRPMVRSFIRSLVQLVPSYGAVLLLAHVDKGTSRAGKQAGAEAYSGSTAWHNSVRSRLFLLETAPGELELQHQKSNLGPKQPPLRLEWPQDGVMHVVQTGGVVAAIQSKADAKALLRLIHEFAQRGEFVATSTSSRHHAAKLFAEEKTYPKVKPAEVFAMLRDAERHGWLHRDQYRDANRKPHERWALTDAGCEVIGFAPSAPCAPTSVVGASHA